MREVDRYDWSWVLFGISFLVALGFLFLIIGKTYPAKGDIKVNSIGYTQATYNYFENMLAPLSRSTTTPNDPITKFCVGVVSKYNNIPYKYKVEVPLELDEKKCLM